MAIVADKSGANPLAQGSYCTHLRTSAGSPLTATLAPLFVGEVVLDITNGVRYIAKTMLSTGWCLYTNIPTGV